MDKKYLSLEKKLDEHLLQKYNSNIHFFINLIYF